MNWKRKNDKAMKKLFLFALFATLCCSCSKDDQIDLYMIHVPKKGTLAAVLEEKGLNAGTIVSLKITGELNEEDFIPIQSMTNLVKIDLSEVNLPMLFERAFCGNNMIKKVTLPKNLETIGDYAFAECTSLTSIEITSTVETIGDYAFDYCTSLKTVTFEKGSHLKTIGDQAFSECTFLTSIEIPESVTTIGDEAFYFCDLTSIKIPKSVETIGEGAFGDCALKTVTFEQNSRIQTIGRFAFMRSDIVTVDMSQYKRNDITIGERAFSECPKLQLFKIGANIPPHCSDAFGNINLYSVLKVPSGSIDAYKAATGWNSFASITGLDE